MEIKEEKKNQNFHSDLNLNLYNSNLKHKELAKAFHSFVNNGNDQFLTKDKICQTSRSNKTNYK